MFDATTFTKVSHQLGLDLGPEPTSLPNRSSKPKVSRQHRLMRKAVVEAYLAAGGHEMDNRELYDALAKSGACTPEELARQAPVGKAGSMHSVARRQIRWVQQTLRTLNMLERDTTKRGRWRLTDAACDKLTPAPPKRVMIAFATDLGIAVWGSAQDTFRDLGDRIDVCLTSLPYPLARPRRYGNPPLHAYIDFVCDVLTPIARHLRDGGTIALNVSNDIFVRDSPARSSYRERLIIALEDRLALFKLDEIPWINKSKPTGPTQWACIERMQLAAAWEPIYILTNNPHAVLADNRRVLQPHSERHLRLVRSGGEKRTVSNSDGAYRIKPGSYGKETPGRLARNVLEYGHACPDIRAVREAAVAANLAPHGAPMPLALASFLVKWLCPPGGLVVDPCAGYLTTGKAAEINGCRWICSELYAEHVAAAATRFGLPIPETIG